MEKKKVRLIGAGILLALAAAAIIMAVIAGSRSRMGLSLVRTGEPETIKREGDRRNTLVAACDNMEGILNPIYATMGGDAIINSIIYEPLAKRDEKGRWQNVLASSVTVSEDGSSYEIRIKDGIVFCDGTPVTARDALASVAGMCYRSVSNSIQDIYRNIKGMEDYAEDRSRGIQGLELVDDSTIRIHFSVPSYDNIEILSTLVQKGDFASFEAEGDPVEALGGYRSVGIGTGAYMPEGMPSNTLVNLTANPNYRGHIRDIQKVQFIYINYYDYPEYLSNNRVDVILYNHYSELFDTIYGAKQYNVYEQPTDTIYYIAFNQDRRGMADARLRQAIYYGCDVEGLLNSRVRGKLMPARTPAIGGSVYEDAQGLPARNVEKAKELVKEFGDVELTLPVIKGDDVMETVAEAFKKDMKEIGVDVEVVTYEDQKTYLDSVIISQNFDVLLYSEPMKMNYESYARLMADRGSLPIGCHDVAYLGEIEKLKTIYEPEQGYGQFQRLNTMLTEAVPIIPYGRGVNYISVLADLDGYTANQFSIFLDGIANIRVK